jgi:hypothetical protein
VMMSCLLAKPEVDRPTSSDGPPEASSVHDSSDRGRSFHLWMMPPKALRDGPPHRLRRFDRAATLEAPDGVT